LFFHSWSKKSWWGSPSSLTIQAVFFLTIDSLPGGSTLSVELTLPSPHLGSDIKKNPVLSIPLARVIGVDNMGPPFYFIASRKALRATRSYPLALNYNLQPPGVRPCLPDNKRFRQCCIPVLLRTLLPLFFPGFLILEAYSIWYLSELPSLDPLASLI